MLADWQSLLNSQVPAAFHILEHFLLNLLAEAVLPNSIGEAECLLQSRIQYDKHLRAGAQLLSDVEENADGMKFQAANFPGPHPASQNWHLWAHATTREGATGILATGKVLLIRLFIAAPVIVGGPFVLLLLVLISFLFFLIGPKQILLLTRSIKRCTSRKLRQLGPPCWPCLIKMKPGANGSPQTAGQAKTLSSPILSRLNRRRLNPSKLVQLELLLARSVLQYLSSA